MSKEQNNNDGGKPRMPRHNTTWLFLIAALLLCLFFFFDGGDLFGGSSKEKVSYTQFKEYVEQGYASTVVVNKNTSTLKMYIVSGHVRDVLHKPAQEAGDDPCIDVEFGSSSDVEKFLDEQIAAGQLKEYSYENKNSNTFWTILLSFGPILLLIIVWIYIFSRGMGGGNSGNGIFSVGKSRARMYEGGDAVGVTFKDVAGQEGAKQEIKEIVDFLRNPKKYTELGGKIPRGALLVGPPGTGKTLLAKAVAGEAGVPFFSMSGSDFVEMFVGVGASRVRDLFRQAKEKSPCIVFIDEIDAVGLARSAHASFNRNDERENTLNALLAEMDGFGTNSGVILLAATNRAELLDKALLRPGRFDRQIHVELPDLQERKEIFLVHLRPIKVDPNLDIDYLSRQTPGFSGADIANVCNEAALIAARHNSRIVSKQDFLDAIDRIVGGLEKKTKVMTAEEKRTIALHEAGHATVSWFCQYANPLVKVSIVPRGQSLGAAWYLPEERTITTKEQMLDEICSLVAGRAAEELCTGHISTGAMNDLERATKSAFSIIAYVGMGDKLPNICYYNNQDYQFQRPYSETTAKVIDDEVLALINDQYARAKAILTEHREGHKELAELLISKEVIFAEDVERIFGKRPWVSRAQEIIDANNQVKAQEAQQQDDQLDLSNMPATVRQAQQEYLDKQKDADGNTADETDASDPHADDDK